MTLHDDHEAFINAMSDVNPLKNNDKRYLSRPVSQAPSHGAEGSTAESLPLSPLTLLPLTAEPEYRCRGSQPGVMDKLRRGHYRPEGSLSLLRVRPEDARLQLLRFIAEVRRRGGRNILIIHGKSREMRGPANVLRSYLMMWLPELAEVQACCMAAPRDGGSGAMYVSLRKTEACRNDNRERFSGKAPG
ncbi:DNA endonuclease SmrA [Tatumella terrea]|uniref:Smr/MutS family protein n=1 Tax=Tatumella terrea TaxID=419007 RepID=UPI0031D365C3